jgi:hypothetical protein
MSGRLRDRDDRRSDAADRAWPIFHYDGMSERLAKLVRDQPAQRIGRASNRPRHHELNRSAREICRKRTLSVGRCGQRRDAGDRNSD